MIGNTIRIIALCVSSAATAQEVEIIAPEAFEAFATGTTLYFTQNGAPYGAEQYLENRQVIWRFEDGMCEHGEWFTEGQSLCFLYEGRVRPSCWLYVQKGAERAVRLRDDAGFADLDIARQDRQPLYCTGPEIGVSYEGLR